jgi:hypothetical protein
MPLGWASRPAGNEEEAMVAIDIELGGGTGR